ncbi:MAG TPA: NAD(P)H:quinone oxidoreductase [Actinobacteria bacterium]|nr:NAD(P)H:quinone oxidoreductase [Actinomycetota bacterium]
MADMRKTRVLVVFYSMTGNTAALARSVAQSAEEHGAQVRMRQVKELISHDVIEANPKMKQVKEELTDVPIAGNDDLEWADGIAFGTPTRYGTMTAQMKEFIDQTGALWSAGKLVDKVAGFFTSTATLHGGQESTLLSMITPVLHFGMIPVGVPYSDAQCMFELTVGGGSPYGASSVSGPNADRPPTDNDLIVARALGARITKIASRMVGVAEERKAA